MSQPESGELVFVYGTLRRGGSNAFRMDRAEFVGRGRVEGKLHVVSWYPGLVLGRDLGWVAGEIYRVGPEQMRALDEFEGISANEIEGAEYRRVEAEVLLKGVPCEETILAWAYEWTGPVDEGKRIPLGDWLDVVQPRQSPVFTWIGIVSALSLLVPVAVWGTALLDPDAASGRFRVWAAVVSFYTLPILGIAAGLFAQRRREKWPLARRIATSTCWIWLLIWAVLGGMTLLLWL